MRHSAYAFAIEVERQIEALSHESLLVRRGQSKVLQEEWYAIARLGLHLKQPGLEVEVEAFGDSRVADGHIIESGFREREFDVQVVYAGYDYEEALRREHMVKAGFVPGTGPIRRDKKTGDVVATMAAVDSDYSIKRVAASLAERFEKKAARSYPQNTVLLLAFQEIMFSGRAYWDKLLALVDGQVSLGTSNFSAVYFLNCSTNELNRAA